MLGNREFRDQCASAGRKNALAHFTADSMADGLVALIRERVPGMAN
jgi:hypothetical protein